MLTSNIALESPDLNAIEITVNDVTLDLNGHTIQGPHTGPPWGGSGNGIYANEKFNITIRNGRIWGFGGSGINLIASSQFALEGTGHCVNKIHVANNGTAGIYIYSGLVKNCTAIHNGFAGIQTYYSLVTDCICNKNYNGFYFSWYNFK